MNGVRVNNGRERSEDCDPLSEPFFSGLTGLGLSREPETTHFPPFRYAVFPPYPSVFLISFSLLFLQPFSACPVLGFLLQVPPTSWLSPQARPGQALDQEPPQRQRGRTQKIKVADRGRLRPWRPLESKVESRKENCRQGVQKTVAELRFLPSIRPWHMTFIRYSFLLRRFFAQRPCRVFHWTGQEAPGGSAIAHCICWMVVFRRLITMVLLASSCDSRPVWRLSYFLSGWDRGRSLCLVTLPKLSVFPMPTLLGICLSATVWGKTGGQDKYVR